VTSQHDVDILTSSLTQVVEVPSAPAPILFPTATDDLVLCRFDGGVEPLRFFADEGESVVAPSANLLAGAIVNDWGFGLVVADAKGDSVELLRRRGQEMSLSLRSGIK